MIGSVIIGMAAWEALWWNVRRSRRASTYAKALAHARSLGRPLVVIGAPDGGFTGGYGCGDITVDMTGSLCPRFLRADITQGIPLANDSVCCLTVCTLEYVADVGASLREIMRISGGHAFFVGVEPWTLTAYLYPGAKRILPARYR